jgi:hypothetical protein
MLKLPSVTLTATASVPPYVPATAEAVRRCLRQVEFRNVVIFSGCPREQWEALLVGCPLDNVHIEPIAPFDHWSDASVFGFKAHNYAGLFGSHVLCIGWDGWVANTNSWSDEFLKYDWVGAPWQDGIVGNNGFGLLSTRLLVALKDLPKALDAESCHPFDNLVCRDNWKGKQGYRSRLEEMGMQWAPTKLARTFSVAHELYSGSFGFHGDGAYASFFFQRMACPGLDLVRRQPTNSYRWNTQLKLEHQYIPTAVGHDPARPSIRWRFRRSLQRRYIWAVHQLRQAMFGTLYSMTRKSKSAVDSYSVKRVLLLVPGDASDVDLYMPAIRRVRAFFSSAHIESVSTDGPNSQLDHTNLVDKNRQFCGFSETGLHLTQPSSIQAIIDLRRQNFDLAIDLTGCEPCRQLAFLSGARSVWGCVGTIFDRATISKTEFVVDNPSLGPYIAGAIPEPGFTGLAMSILDHYGVVTPEV